VVERRRGCSLERRMAKLSLGSGLRFPSVRLSVFTIRMMSIRLPSMLIIDVVIIAASSK